MQSYGGVDLPQVNPELAAWVGANLTPKDVFEWAEVSWPGRNRTAWAWGAGYEHPAVEVGRLLWPVGASRFACGHFLAGSDQLDRILRLAVPSPATLAPLDFVFKDKAGGKFSTKLYLLPPRPLAHFRRSKSESNLFLLTLVDARYFWWEKAAAVAVTGGTTTWSSLLAAIGTALGETVTPDTIPSAYLKPSTELSASYEYLPLLLDAVCACVGHRLVRKLDGTVVTQSARTALAAEAAQDGGVEPYRAAGGDFYFRVQDTRELVQLAPASVVVRFPAEDANSTPVADYAVTTNLADLDLPEYGGARGHPGKKSFHASALAHYATYPGTPANAAELASLATQIATDHYLWLLGKKDASYEGLRDYVPHGMVDRVIWRDNVSGANTRLIRGNLREYNEELAYIGATYGSATPPCCDGGVKKTSSGGEDTTVFPDGLIVTPGGSQVPITVTPQSTSTSTYDILINKAGDSTTPVWTVDPMGGQVIIPGDTTTTALTINQISGSTVNYITVNDSGGNPVYQLTKDGELILSQSTTSTATFNIPTGTAPTSPVAGDIWTTSAGVFYYDGTTTHDLTSGGTSPTATNGQTALGSDYTLTGSMAGSGLSVVLPTSGKKYKITASVLGTQAGTTNTGVRIQVKLRDTTAGADVSNTLKTFCTAQVTGLNVYESCVIDVEYTNPGTNSHVEVYAQYVGTGAGGKLLGNSTDGYCQLSYWQMD